MPDLPPPEQSRVDVTGGLTDSSMSGSPTRVLGSASSETDHAHFHSNCIVAHRSKSTNLPNLDDLNITSCDDVDPLNPCQVDGALEAHHMASFWKFSANESTWPEQCVTSVSINLISPQHHRITRPTIRTTFSRARSSRLTCRST